MPTVEHSTLPNSDLHEPKGINSASEGSVYVADGSGSGDWENLPSGWGLYKHGGATQSVTTTPSLLIIDGADAETEESYLPRDIRGTDSLWDTTNNKITPVALGDSYNVRIDLSVTAEATSPTELIVELDTAGSTYGSADIKTVSFFTTGRSTPYTVSFSFPINCLSNFVTNGGQLWVHTDTGSLTIDSPSIFIDRNTDGTL